MSRHCAEGLLDSAARSIGYSGYSAYLSSPHWKGFRLSYRLSGRPQRCRICGHYEFVLHHVRYDNLGHETYDDVVPLCQDHHEAIHEVHKRERIPVENFEEAAALVPGIGPSAAAGR